MAKHAQRRPPSRPPVICRIGGGHAGSDADMLRGLHAFAVPDKNWIIHDLARMGTDEQQIARALRLKPDLVIVHATFRGYVDALRHFCGPIINVSNIDPQMPFFRISPDDRAIGAMAGGYFLTRGYQHFAFVGHDGWQASADRLAGFRAAVVAKGFQVQLVPSPMSADPEQAKTQQTLAADGLRAMAFPAALFADTDTVGREVCECARQAGIRVPEDLAVLGCDNYELVCELSTPALSSVQTPGFRVGFELGKLIERTFAGGPLPTQPRLFPPLGVVTRRSTDTMAITDPHVAAALRLIHMQTARGITITEILREVPISRVQLFRLFKKHLGRSPQEEVFRVRLEAAQKLLANTDLPMPEVARKCGLRDAIHLTRFFRSVAGMTPSAYRRSQSPTRG